MFLVSKYAVSRYVKNNRLIIGSSMHKIRPDFTLKMHKKNVTQLLNKLKVLACQSCLNNEPSCNCNPIQN